MLKSVGSRCSNEIPKFLFFRSSSSSSRSKFHNYYLRKRRKWPHPVYKSRWHEKLSQQHAMQALRHQASSSSSINLLSSLVNSFALYNCDPTPTAYRFAIKTLIKTSQSHHIPPLLHHLQTFEKFETPESVLIDIIEFHGENNEFQEAIDLFFRLPTFRCIPSVDSLNCLLSVLCKRKEGLGVVPQVLLKSRLMNIRLEESSFVILIEALCRFKKPKNAIGLLYHMVDHDIDIDQRSFSLVLLTLCQQNDLKSNEVMSLLEEMTKLGFCLEKTDWGNVIRFLVKRGNGMEALEALSKMKLDGFKPDAICYTMVLDGVISEGDYETADQLFDEMLVLGLIPDINTYNVYMNGLCKQNKFDDGIKMLSSMEELGCKPNMITYNTLLSAIYESGEVGKARDFLKNVRAKGVLLHSRTYQIVIYRMIVTDDIAGALDLLEEMVQKSLVIQPSTFDEIVCRLCQNGLVSKALNLLTELLEKNVLPGCRSWEALIVGFHIKHGFNEIDLNAMETMSS
ncbi:pentatricopeptide repeat-containing protein At2g38420, mitochondrial [Cynara cardunculus var. scolymus]|uniref:Pentatricopeptide repeat-containing protein n=1 Tax=Cynara cardunculus var. scolymus TaxID=59895 RepID=A0A118JU13_CYNCS|nr:pentatricopeptide repeat-containing protein At2g38420, mitochondrial [Cynara cardunculus var. scolymus]KVH90370.1 Pentatricopeptide repeat-containing protein [Cynara cardunculus var. scolymus]